MATGVVWAKFDWHLPSNQQRQSTEGNQTISLKLLVFQSLKARCRVNQLWLVSIAGGQWHSLGGLTSGFALHLVGTCQQSHNLLTSVKYTVTQKKTGTNVVLCAASLLTFDRNRWIFFTYNKEAGAILLGIESAPLSVDEDEVVSYKLQFR